MRVTLAATRRTPIGITQWLGTGTGDQQGELTGMAASPGVAEGPARVISSPGQIDELRNGEILVAPLTRRAGHRPSARSGPR
jgi:pyruvate, water dikinase